MTRLNKKVMRTKTKKKKLQGRPKTFTPFSKQKHSSFKYTLHKQNLLLCDSPMFIPEKQYITFLVGLP